MVVSEQVNSSSELSEPSSELTQLYAQSMQEFEEGQIVKGRIVSITPQEIIVDIGYKSEGSISRYEFTEADTLKVGDEVEVYLETKEDDEGMVVLSKRKAERLQGWERVMEHADEGSIVEGAVTRKVKGGLMVDIGIEAFLPASLAGLKGYTNLNYLLGQKLKLVIVKVSKARKNIVLSRKDYLLREREEARAKFVEELHVGERRQGTIKNITDFGAFVDLGGVDGLLHIADISWSRITHPSEVVKIGEKIEVVVLQCDKDTRKVSLGFKQLQPSPWTGVDERYPVGTRVTGRVVNLMPYGAFVEVEKGVEGLVHISELSWTKRIAHPSELLQVGQEASVVVLGVDAANQKLSLGLRQAQPNPWDTIAERYPIGTRVSGRVKSLTDFGAFIELEEGMDALLHNSDLSWTRRVNHPSELLKKGKAIEAVVLSYDTEARRIAVGIKQLIADPWPTITSKYPVGSVVQGTITKIATFGFFVELEQDVEGLVHISETGLPSGVRVEDRFHPGDAVAVRIIRIEDAERRIGLSLKNV